MSRFLSACCPCLTSVFKGSNSSSSSSSSKDSHIAMSNSSNSLTRSNPILDGPKPERFEDAYAFCTSKRDPRKKLEIGRGHYATVYLAIHKTSGIKVAVKDIDRKKTQDETRLKTEVSILQSVGRHPHIVNLYHVFHLPKKNKLRLVMEYCTGGELFDRLATAPYSSRDAADVTANLASALKFLHDRDIVHRDLKPENLLLVDKNESTWIKLADFGLAKIMSRDHMFTVCGTWAYCAPEVKSQPRDGYTKAVREGFEVDVWSLGVITYIVLSGYHPFDPDGVTPDQDLEYRIKYGIYDFDDEAWKRVSRKAKDFVKKCLVVNPKKRMTIDACLRHPWVAGTKAAIEVAKAEREKESHDSNHLKDKGRMSQFLKTHRRRKEKESKGLLREDEGGSGNDTSSNGDVKEGSK